LSEQLDPVIRVLVVDGQDVFRAGLVTLIDREPDFTAVGEATSVRAAEQLAVVPDVVVIDVPLPDTPLDEVLERLRSRFPEAAIVAMAELTALDDLATVRQALAAGVSGYLSRSATPEELLAGLRSVARGELHLQASIGIALAARPPDEYTMLMVAGLSPRETHVLRLIALGHTNAEVAELIGTSLRTIETDRAQLQQKLGVHTRADLVRVALETGLLVVDHDPPSPGRTD